MDERRELISFYFHLGLSYNEILYFLAQEHTIIISKTHLKRLINSFGLFRRKYETDILEVAIFVENQLSSSGVQHGYKWMHLKCRQAGLNVSSENVRILLTLLDPVGVDLRKRKRLHRRAYHSKGPIFAWHLDGYDKLKPYGICISGCIDGYSRMLIWLEAHSTNSDPRVILGYFINAIENTGGCPKFVRGDHGTENVHVAAMQNLFRDESFRYGKSTSNTRIERLWGSLRKECMQFWIDYFGRLKDDDHFTGSFVDVNVMQFCFMQLINKELQEFLKVWNTHVIRHSRNQKVPNGRPVVLHNLPSLFGAEDNIQDVRHDYVQACKEETTERTLPCDDDIYQLCMMYMNEHKLQLDADPYACGDLYITLKNMLLNDLNV